MRWACIIVILVFAIVAAAYLLRKNNSITPMMPIHYAFKDIDIKDGEATIQYRVHVYDPPIDLSNLQGTHSLAFDTPESTIISLYRAMANSDINDFKKCWHRFSDIRKERGWEPPSDEKYIEAWKNVASNRRIAKWIIQYRNHFIVLDEFVAADGDTIRNATPLKLTNGNYLGSYELSFPETDPLLRLISKTNFDVESGQRRE